MPQTTFTESDILRCREITILGLEGEPVDIGELIA